jgi:cation-transporting ATPase 13A3/4/5
MENENKKSIKWIPIEFVDEGNEENEPLPEDVKWSEIGDNKDPALEVSNAPEYVPQQISDSLALQIEKTAQSIRRSHIASQARKRNATMLSDEENEVDEGKYPWDDAGEAYSLVFTGKSFDFLMKSDPTGSQESTKKLLKKSVVFARMSPDGKALLIDALQNQNQLVGMCGDGANDCVALKAADVGISLSEAEASIAAPFTSKTPDISCVIKLLREGRAALSTSFICFKYMALYSMIQFTSATILYSLKVNLTDWQFMYSDILIIFPIAVTMSWTKAASGLSKQQPLNTLICWTVLSSIIGQVLLVVAFQVLSHLTFSLVL